MHRVDDTLVEHAVSNSRTQAMACHSCLGLLWGSQECQRAYK
jgi:hypothetical protein